MKKFDPETFALIHRVMLQAPFLLARALLPGMYAQVTLWAPPKSAEANAVSPR